MIPRILEIALLVIGSVAIAVVLFGMLRGLL